jgi:L-fuconolactonase
MAFAKMHPGFTYRGNHPRTTEALAEWLAQRVREVALEPDLPIVDAHHHLWDFPNEGRRYLFPDLLADINGGHNIVATVFVEAASMLRADGPMALRPVGEVEFACGAAVAAESGIFGRSRIASAIVAHADLTLGENVLEVLEAELQASGGRLRGIRHQAAYASGTLGRFIGSPAPEHLLLDRKFQAGFSQLGRLGLSFDAWLYHPQLDDLMQIAARFPETTIVMNHVGGVLGVDVFQGKRAEIYNAWRKDIAKLAEYDNVVVKLGGLGMPMFGFGFEVGELPPSSEELVVAWKPYIEHCIECFGPARCMFESNFPVDRQSCDYNSLWNAFKRMTAGMSQSERSNLFSNTAIRTYRINGLEQESGPSV